AGPGTVAAVAGPVGGDDLPPPAAARVASAGFPLSLPVPGQSSASPMEAPRPSLASAPRPPLAGTGDPVLDELRELQGQNSSQMGVAAAYRTRDGEAGLGGLDELQVPLEG